MDGEYADDGYGEFNFSAYDYHYYGSESGGPVHTVHRYVWAALLVVGTVTNVVGSVVMYHLGREVLSTCVYLTVVSWADLVVLYTRCGNEWFVNVIGYDLTSHLMTESESICKVLPFFFNFFFHLSRWLVVCSAIEGCILTTQPHKVRVVCSLLRAKAVILLLTVLLMCLNIHYFWSFEILNDPVVLEFRMCTFLRYGYHYSEVFQTVIFPVLDILLGEVLPLLVVTVCILIMAVQIGRQRHKGSDEFQQWQERYELYRVEINQLKVMLLLLGVFFVVLSAPKFVYTFLVHMHFIAPENATNLITTLMYYCCLSFKLVLYIASSGIFRTHLHKSFTPHCRQRYSTLPSDTSSPT